MGDHREVLVYKASAEKVSQFAALSSWTSSRALAERYTTRQFAGFGGPCVYVTTAIGTRLDLRADAGGPLADLGFDLEDYGSEPLHDVLRVIAPALRAHGIRWVGFCEDPTDASCDEWLYLGPDPFTADPDAACPHCA